MLLHLGKRVHVSWFIAWLCLGAVIGIAISAAIGSSPRVPGSWAVAAALACVVVLWRRFRWLAVVALLAGITLGLWRGGIEQLGLQRYRLLYGHTVTVRGTVRDDPGVSADGSQQLSMTNVVINGQALNGQVWISTDSAMVVRRSDSITLRGKLGSGFGSLAASMFRATIVQVDRPQPGDIGLRIRDWFAGGIRQSIPEPEASLASGYLVGQRSALPINLDAQLKTVGLTHAVVASGYNLTILVSVARQLLIRVSKYLATASAALLIAGFIMVSGTSPSMVRAGIVTSLSLAAWYYGRRVHPLVLLPFVAALTAFFNPFYVWGDIGWYLSFTSFAGVIILAPLIQHALWRGRAKPGILMQILIDTMSAQLATLPIMIFTFGHYSPYALLANLLVLPLVPLTMLLTFVAGLAGLALPGIASLAGLPATTVLRYMTWVVSHIAELPGAQGELAINAAVLACSYVVLSFIAFALWRATSYNPRQHEAAIEA